MRNRLSSKLVARPPGPLAHSTLRASLRRVERKCAAAIEDDEMADDLRLLLLRDEIVRARDDGVETMSTDQIVSRLEEMLSPPGSDAPAIEQELTRRRTQLEAEHQDNR